MTDPAAHSSGADLRTTVIAACRELARRGLTYAKSGNVSVRCDERRFFVSPTGMDYEGLQADDIPLMDLDGRWFGHRRPSSEWRLRAARTSAARRITRSVHRNFRTQRLPP